MHASAPYAPLPPTTQEEGSALRRQAIALEQWFSKSGPRPSSLRITWELVSHAKFLVPTAGVLTQRL